MGSKDLGIRLHRGFQKKGPLASLLDTEKNSWFQAGNNEQEKEGIGEIRKEKGFGAVSYMMTCQKGLWKGEIDPLFAL